MAKYNVLCVGYKNPNPDKIRDFIKFEADYIAREHKNKKIFINRGAFLHFTEEINPDTLADFSKNRIEYNLDSFDLDTVADCHGVQNFTITL